ncbi:TPA: hypothetical protein ACE6PF_002171, partial [Neisseria gonorrhoeae]
PVRGFAKCAKARDAEERAKHYPRTNPCAAGAFQTASGAAIAKRTAALGEYPGIPEIENRVKTQI